MKTARSDPARFPDFRGDHRFVSDYLRLEVLEHMSEDEVRFLTHTSVLDSMCGPLCDAVLDRSDSTQVLAALERTNRFLVPLDDHRKRYRYHRSRSASRRLDRAEPSSGRSSAAKRCSGAGQRRPEAAVRYGHEAKEHEAVTTRRVLGMSVYCRGASTLETARLVPRRRKADHRCSRSRMWVSAFVGRAAERWRAARGRR
jgi:LuxR family maltose regulon positive regulatory protein